MLSEPFSKQSNSTASTPGDRRANGSLMAHWRASTVVQVPVNASSLTDWTDTPTNDPQYHI